MSLFASVDELLASYAEYLGVMHPASLQPFKQRLSADREGAIAEAVVFVMLQSFRVRPEVNEVPGTGGPDFLCSATGGSPILALREPTSKSRFVVEATSLDSDAVTARSHLPNELKEGGGAYALVTSAIFAKAKKKAVQLRNVPMPRILAVVSSHAQTGALFNTYAAQEILISRIHWRQEIGSNKVDPNEYTDLSMSAFMKPGPDGSILPARLSISAILLVAVHETHSIVHGILHPEPAYPLSEGFLPEIPFLRIARWPIVDGRISTEWVIAHPEGKTVHHWKVSLPRKKKATTV